MKAKKLNKIYDVNEITKNRYLKDGFDIYDDKGNLIENAPSKTVPYEEYEKVKKELEEIKKQISKTK